MSRDAIVDAGLAVLREDGLDAVTMRRLASVLRTGPASLYVYFADRDALLEAMLDRVLAEVPLEAADPGRWRAQVHSLMDETVAALLRHPGIARVGLANVPTAGAALRIREAMLGALLAGGIAPEAAGGAIDTLPLLALATAVESGVYAERGTDLKAERRRITRAYEALPADEFPLIARHLDAVLGGGRADRFSLAVDTFLDGLTGRGERHRR